MSPLQTAIYDVERGLLDLEDAIDPASTKLVRDAWKLIGALRRYVAHSSPDDIYRAFGAPGDYGYETPIGSAIWDIYQGKKAVGV